MVYRNVSRLVAGAFALSVLQPIAAIASLQCPADVTSYFKASDLTVGTSNTTFCYPIVAPYQNQEWHDGSGHIIELGGATGQIGTYSIVAETATTPAYILYNYTTAGNPVYRWAAFSGYGFNGGIVTEWCAVDATGAVTGAGSVQSISVLGTPGSSKCIGG